MSAHLPAATELTPESVRSNPVRAFRNLERLAEPDVLTRMRHETATVYARLILDPDMLVAFVPGLTLTRLAQLMPGRGYPSHLSRIYRGLQPVVTVNTLLRIIQAIQRAAEQHERGEFVPGDPRGQWRRAKPAAQGST